MWKRSILLSALILAAPLSAMAQDADKYTRPDGVRERFVFRVGFLFPSHDTFTRLQPAGLPDIPGVDLETDTNFPDSTTDLRLEASFRLGRRHLIRAGWVEMNRDTSTRLKGQLEWGDEVFPIDAEILGNWDTRVLKLDYRYSLIKKERVDFGISAGFFVMRTATGLGLAGSSTALAEDAKKTAPLPMLGLDVEWLLADRLMLRAGGQYFAVSLDDSLDGDWQEIRAALEWNATRNVGLGAGYLFAKVDLKAQFTDAKIREFEYRYRFNGPTVYAFANF